MLRFGDKKIIGMVHLPPLPGKSGYKGMNHVMKSGLRDARSLEQGGIDAVLVENYGDMPFSIKVSKETVAAMTMVCCEIKKILDVPVGVNVLRNDWEAALGLAKVLNLDFIRVNVYTGATATEQGIIEGEAAQIHRYKNDLNINASVLADIHVKHGEQIYPMDIVKGARDAVDRGKADGIIISGEETGTPVDLVELKRAKDSVQAPVLVGSGLTVNNAINVLKKADGAIVGTSIKENEDIHNQVSVEKVKELMEEVSSIS